MSKTVTKQGESSTEIVKIVSHNPLIVIPARMASVRLPGKPLADICGLPMIVQVVRRAEEAKCGRIIVAAAEQEIVDAVTNHGGEAILTDPNHPSGSDRVWEAVRKADPDAQHDVIVNVQGDLPTLAPGDIKASLEPLDAAPDLALATLAAEIKRAEERDNPNVVKAVCAFEGDQKWSRALYFTRATAPYGDGPLYHHIGLYAYRRDALERFVSIAPSALERREKLEQLRALESGMNIGVRLVSSVPLGVDTPEDLDRARKALGG